jgi:hypothetical protein
MFYFMKSSPVLALVVLLVGCATSYQKQGFWGDGYTDTQLDDRTFSVEFRGNTATSRQAVETSLLYRCAELTATAGYDYFVILRNDTERQDLPITMPGEYLARTTYLWSGLAITRGTYEPGSTINYTSYGANALIRVFRGVPPPDNPTAFDAKVLMRNLSLQMPGTFGVSAETEMTRLQTLPSSSQDAYASKETRERPLWRDASQLVTYKVSRNTKLYSQPQEDASHIATLQKGTRVRVTGVAGGHWLRIESRSSNRPPGYLRQEDAVVVEE